MDGFFDCVPGINLLSLILGAAASAILRFFEATDLVGNLGKGK